jgi:hypothetical protein
MPVVEAAARPTETSWLLNWDTSPILPIAGPNRPDFHTPKRMCARVWVYRARVHSYYRNSRTGCRLPNAPLEQCSHRFEPITQNALCELTSGQIGSVRVLSQLFWRDQTNSQCERTMCFQLCPFV